MEEIQGRWTLWGYPRIKLPFSSPVQDVLTHFSSRSLEVPVTWVPMAEAVANSTSIHSFGPSLSTAPLNHFQMNCLHHVSVSGSMFWESQAKTLCLFCTGLNHMKLSIFDHSWPVKMAISYGLMTVYLYLGLFQLNISFLRSGAVLHISHPQHQLPVADTQ